MNKIYGPSFQYDTATSRGTVDGRPNLNKRRAKIVYDCCEVYADALITNMCWVCGKEPGVFWDKISPTHPMRRAPSGALMKFSDPGNNELNIMGIIYEPGHWNRSHP